MRLRVAQCLKKVVFYARYAYRTLGFKFASHVFLLKSN